MKDRERKIADMNAELERLRRRIAELESRTAGDGRPEEELRETLLRQHAILNNIPDIAWLKDRESRFIAVNGPFGEACGFSPADIAGKTDLDIWPRDLAEGYRTDDAEVMRSGKRKRVEESLIGPNGRETWIETIKTPILDAQGRVIGTTGIAREITERKQAETKIRSIGRLYAFLSQINQAIVRTRDHDELFRTICRVAIEFGQFRMAWVGLIDEATGIVRPAANAGQVEGYLNILSIGISDENTSRGPTGSALREGVLSICDDVATDPRMRPWREEALKRGYRSSAAIPFRLKEKVIGSLNLYASEPGFFTEDERKLLTGIGVDISFALDTMEIEKERKRTEEALFESRERYRRFFENAAVAVALVDQSGHVVEANDADCRFLGYTRSELVGMHFTQFTHPQDVDIDLALYQALLSGQRKGYEIEKRYIRKDGETVWGRLAVSLIGDSQGLSEYTLVVCVDITERKQVQEALRESEHRYRTLFETMAQGVVYHAPDGRIISANPAAERILGVSIEHMQGRTPLDPRWRAIREDGSAFPGDHHPAMEALRTGRQVHGVTMGVFHPGDNEYRWILVDAVPEFLPGEARPYQVHATFTDLTERRQAELALQTAKEYAENLIETTNSMVVGMDVCGNVTVFNRAAEAITGYNRSELQGRNWIELIVPKERYPLVWTEFERLMAEGVPRNFENHILTKSGEERYIVWQNNKVYENERIAGTISFGIDITDRRQAAEDLRRRTQGLAALLEVSKGLAATLDMETVLQAATDGVAHLFGMGTAAVYLLEGDTLRLGATTPPLPSQFPEELRNAPLADHPHIREAITSRMPVFVPDVVTADLTAAERAVAEKRGLRTLLFLPLIAGVEPLGTLIVGSIAGPRTIPESEIDLCRTLSNLAALAVENARLYTSGRQYADDLEKQIAERRKAEQERLELERRLLHAQKLESLGILAGGIAHDFNNLLMAVLGNLDLALRKLSAVSPARLNIEQSAQTARRAADLTRQMLAYSGKGSFVVKPMDLSELVEENAHLFRSSVARTTELDVRLDRSLPAIAADAGQVQQVIMNLITNASEAVGEGAGMITLTTGAQECDSQCLKRSRIEDVPDAGRFVFLEVSDNGCGMDEETQQKLFDPFFTTKAMGRGLGMSAILGIARGHGGAILVDSAAGKGTTIRILFPAMPGALALKDDPDVAAAAREAEDTVVGGTVLVVDDEAIVRNVCKEMVEALGLKVLTAVDGRDAVEVFTKHADDISLVILDLSMPNMDGMTALKELVRIRPSVKVILCSGFDEQDSLRRLSGQRLAGFIQKPYSMDNLRTAIERAGGAGS